jgi:DNA-binding CsgD family transcriptional regulator
MAQKRKVNPVQSVWELQWRERIEAWRRSGQTQQEFCRAHGLSVGSFSHWKAELVRREGLRTSVQAADAVVPVVPDGDRRKGSPEALSWSEVRWPAGAAEVAGDGGGFEIVLPRGLSVRLGPRFEAESLRRLLSVLEERPC